MGEEKYFFEKEIFSKQTHNFKFEYDKGLIEEILKYKKRGIILELGCGEGGNALELSKKGFDVTCIDISKTAINKIKKEAIMRKLKLKALKKDLENYELKKNFDVILSNGLFHFLSENKALKLICNCKRHTNKRGINVFETMLQGDPTQKYNPGGCYFIKNKLKDLYSDWKIESYEEYEESDQENNLINKLGRIVAIKI